MPRLHPEKKSIAFLSWANIVIEFVQIFFETDTRKRLIDVLFKKNYGSEIFIQFFSTEMI